MSILRSSMQAVDCMLWVMGYLIGQERWLPKSHQSQLNNWMKAIKNKKIINSSQKLAEISTHLLYKHAQPGPDWSTQLTVETGASGWDAKGSKSASLVHGPNWAVYLKALVWPVGSLSQYQFLHLFTLCISKVQRSLGRNSRKLSFCFSKCNLQIGHVYQKCCRFLSNLVEISMVAILLWSDLVEFIHIRWFSLGVVTPHKYKWYKWSTNF